MPFGQAIRSQLLAPKKNRDCGVSTAVLHAKKQPYFLKNTETRVFHVLARLQEVKTCVFHAPAPLQELETCVFHALGGLQEVETCVFHVPARLQEVETYMFHGVCSGLFIKLCQDCRI